VFDTKKLSIVKQGLENRRKIGIALVESAEIAQHEANWFIFIL
jgi:hypothetical protein